MIPPNFPIPAALFTSPAGADWTKPDDYPPIHDDDVSSQRFAWEFLRRNARYAASFEALQNTLQAVKDSADRAQADEQVDRFCLMWQIAKPVAPTTKWSELDEATLRELIGPPAPKVIFPVLNNLSAIGDGEVAPSSDELVPILQTQVLVRVSVGGDASAQGKWVTEILEKLRRRKPVKTYSDEKLASLHDYDAPLRYVRIAPGLIGKRDGGIINDVRELTYGRTLFRITPFRLHFALRTLDAVAREHDVQRNDLHNSSFDSPGREDPDEKRRWLREYPFGEAADEWVRPLSKRVAKTFRHQYKHSQLDTRRFTEAYVREWMRMALHYVLEQGYVQIAMSKLNLGDDAG